ncbi:Fic family protein [Aliarcobacter thereius]|uniref:Fic/DOC family protein n=1 Tax=Aliarcobacter thereius LMG 24486 TaxID=1032240 RepID=A0A1C7WPC4_9BACT|nr:Fic family protein [Aliarcobacter thereius]OCL95601.1 Fic/DOC family protein [Aliarcobacter thereius LMG 24486]QBF16414.1 Fic domain-containing protein [Aliarcobacter thereius LMG 24486]TLS91493.1 Fic family protein [Aliarcobacter thereius]
MQKEDFRKLDELKSKLDSFRPLSSSIVKNLHEDLLIRWTYHSNAIEGNTLTLKETKVALEGITIGGKTLREHFEAINHKDAILFIEELAQKENILSEYSIKQIHSLILKNIDDENKGKYRTTNVIISGAEHKPPRNFEVQSQMQEFIKEYEEKRSKLHPIELASFVHIEFVKIHPFIDGNGRASRLLMNLELIKAGFPPVVIELEDRLDYYKALDIAHTTKNYKPFLELMKKVVEKSFEPYFYVLDF